MASGPGQPGRGPGRLADSLARHPWITAAGMTATVAAVAGGGLALAFSGGSGGPDRDCGLVPCAAALPASVRTSASGPASGPGSGSTPAPASAPPASAPPSSVPPSAAPSSPLPSSGGTAPEAAAPQRTGPGSPAEPVSFPAPAASAGRAVAADHAIGVGYGIAQDGRQGIHGQIVIVNNGPAAVTGWQIRIVLPGDTDYQVLDAANRSAGDALVLADPAGGQAIAAGGTEVIAFTARGTTAAPVQSTFTDSPRVRHSGGQAAAAPGQDAGAGTVQAGTGPRRHDGWRGGWLGGWLSATWPAGGWPGGSWPGRDGAGLGGPPGGQPGRHHGW